MDRRSAIKQAGMFLVGAPLVGAAVANAEDTVASPVRAPDAATTMRAPFDRWVSEVRSFMEQWPKNPDCNTSTVRALNSMPEPDIKDLIMLLRIKLTTETGCIFVAAVMNALMPKIEGVTLVNEDDMERLLTSGDYRIHRLASEVLPLCHDNPAEFTPKALAFYIMNVVNGMSRHMAEFAPPVVPKRECYGPIKLDVERKAWQLNFYAWVCVAQPN